LDSAAEPCAFLFLTYACNLACRHCYIGDRAPDGHMEEATIIRALHVIREAGITDLRLTGGEPTVHPLVFQTVMWAKELDFRVRLNTNGLLLLTDARTRPLVPELAGCWISVFGLTDEAHQRMSPGGPPLGHVLEFAGALAAKGHSIGVRCLLMPGAKDGVHSFLTRCLNAGLARVRFVPVQRDGRASLDAEMNWVSWPTELEEIIRTCTDSPLARNFDILSVGNPFDLTDQFDAPTDSCVARRRKLWSIAPNGDVFECCLLVTDRECAVASVWDPSAARTLGAVDPFLPRKCRFFTPYLPGTPTKQSCPMSSLDLRVKTHV